MCPFSHSVPLTTDRHTLKQEPGQLIDAEPSESGLIKLDKLFDYEVQELGDVAVFKSVGVGVRTWR